LVQIQTSLENILRASGAERARFYGSHDNFTPRAQQVLALARKEADRFNHNFVGTEHVLLGLIALGQGTAVTVLGEDGT
jgi:ATP-dependent Clp protease ATP-binding subunit ClpA